MNDFIVGDAEQDEWIFALLIEALASPRSLVGRIFCKCLACFHLISRPFAILGSDHDVFINSVRSWRLHATLELDVGYLVSS